jgi:pimeloyl-ACP methyl ester carboxylesterase
VFLLGHSYGAHCALAAALLLPRRIEKLVLYEAPQTSIADRVLDRLEAFARVGAWDEIALTFFRDALFVPAPDLEALRETEQWPPIVADAKSSLADLRALHRYRFDVGRCARLERPVLLQVGSESRRDLYLTDALAAVLPGARVEELAGQAHEGMTTAPEAYARSVTRFLLSR